MKFSIIIPAYNAERYIRRIVRCVLAQSYSDWELIIVDDGSTDNTYHIANSFAKNDSRISVLRQANSGPGIARNSGIQYATGDYIAFVDADDIIDNDYLKLLSMRAVENYDIIFIDVMQIRKGGVKVKAEKMSQYRNLGKDALLRSMMTGKAPWGGVRKIVKASILKEYDVKYSNLKIGEEALFSFKTLYFSKKISFVEEKPIYFYELHEDSQSNIKVLDPWGGVVPVLRDFLISEDIYARFANTLNALNVAATIVSIDRISLLYNGKERKKIIDERMQVYFSNYDKKYGIDLNNLVFKAKIFIPLLNMNCIWPLLVICKLRKILS